MNLGSICQRRIVALDRGEPLERAAQLLRDAHVGALVITESTPQGLRVAGIVTDRDLAVQALGENADAQSAEVGEYLDGTVVSAPEDADLATGIECMREAGVRRLLLHDDAGHLTGLVSFDDLFTACSRQLAALAEVSQRGIQRETEAMAEVPASALPMLRLSSVGTAGWAVPAA